MKYKTKPCEIEAIQYTGKNADEVLSFAGEKNIIFNPHVKRFWIETLEGMMNVSPKDYIIRGLQGEIYPCKPDIFQMKYEPVN